MSVHISKRLNWLDWCLLGLLIVGVVGGAFGIFLWKGRSGGERGTVVYTLLLAGMESSVSDPPPLLAGESVKNENGTLSLGRIVSARAEPHRIPTVANGGVVFAETSDRVDYYVTVSASAARGAVSGIRVGDVRIAAGQVMHLRLGHLFCRDAQTVAVEWREVLADEAETVGAD